MNLNEVVQKIKNSDKQYYVYIMKKPDGSPFYIGKGTKRSEKDQRITWHEREACMTSPYAKNPYFNYLKCNVIRKIWRDGGVVQYDIDSWYDCEKLAYTREKELIAQLGRRVMDEGPLTNITEGGEKEAGLPQETKEKISQTLKRYHEKHPEIREEMSRRAKKYFDDNPDAIENARRNSIENNTADHIRNWLQEVDPEILAEKHKQHSEFMKEWHASEEGKAKTKEVAEKRKEQFQTEEHRNHMAEKTREFIKNNPEADKARREKTKAAKQPAIDARQKVLREIQDQLFDQGLIRKKCEYITPATVYNWKKRGIKIDV